jgi:translation initiation factor 5B
MRSGKTKLLDNIRRSNVQKGEAGGITQQIGATWIPRDEIVAKTTELAQVLSKDIDMKLPGLLIIDTPGHESFTNLRSRGSGLCDIAILVVDLMAGLEQQTIESINLLKMRKTPFIIALNKIDRCYDWKAITNAPFKTTFAQQKIGPQQEFETRTNKIKLQLSEQGLNTELYWQNPDVRKYVNIVPTSAITGEG